MAYRLNPIVAKASPNLYAAAKSANIPMEQGAQLEQFSWTIDKNKKLNQLPIDAARKEFEGLDPSAQEKLKFLFATVPLILKLSSSNLLSVPKFSKRKV